MWNIVLYWLVGFIVSAVFVVPFVILHNIKSTASAAAHDIRGS